MKFDELLEIDSIDKKILKLYQENPQIGLHEIAEKLHKSQSIIGTHITKLKKKNICLLNVGIDFNFVDVKYARIDVIAKKVDRLMYRLKNCPLIENCFKIMGTYNLMIEVVAPNAKIIDEFVDKCFRKDPNIKAIRYSFFIKTIRKSLLKLNFDIENNEKIEKFCRNCH